MKKSLLALGGFCLSVLSSTSSFARCPSAIEFPEFSSLSSSQQAVIMTYLPTAYPGFEHWAKENNGLATEVLANTQALQHLDLVVNPSKTISAIHLIVKLKQVAGDRIKAQLDSDTFDEWRKNGAKYVLHHADGKIESGSFDFDRGDLGGSRHHGYDIQGYTSMMKIPRIQINYRLADHEDDIDIDAYAPWIFGVLPNPEHLTWNNSDPRCWLKRYEKKFGKLSVTLKKLTPGEALSLATDVGDDTPTALQDPTSEGVDALIPEQPLEILPTSAAQ